MERWVLASKLLESGLIEEVNLISAVRSGELIAYDCNSDQPIDWKTIEEQFRDIAILCEAKRRVEDGALLFFQIDDLKRRAIVTNARLSSVPRCDPVPWNILYDYLKSRREVEIPETQYYQILEGWGNNQISYYVKAAKFKENDLFEVGILPQEARKKLTQSSEKALLKFIGALLEIHYLNGKNAAAYRKGSSPNSKAIAEKVCQDLALTNIDTTGIGDSTVRKHIIPSAVEAIKENKSTSGTI